MLKIATPKPANKLGVTLLLALAAISAVPIPTSAADASGLWKWTTPGRGGGRGRITNLQLKADGDKLTGAVITPNRTNDTFSEVEIKNGKLNGNELAFETIRAGRSGTNFSVTKYTGKLSGDKIEGQIVSPGRDGATQTTDWKAERNTTGQLVSGPKIVIKPGYDEAGHKIVNETKYKALSVDEAEKYLVAHPDAIVLDLRPASAYADGHLPNARNIDVTDEATYKDALAPLDKTKRYVVHSVVGHFRTVRALEYFEANGFEHAVAIDGGYAAWAAAGKPTVK